jgi:hypothetical protein
MLPPPHGVAFGSIVHVPTEPAMLHAWQSSSQAVAQQTSSTQKPEAHCPPLAQLSPFGRSPVHWPDPSQNEPATQLPSPAQLVAQASPSHWV